MSKTKHIKPSKHARVTDTAPERIAALHNILVKERELCNGRVVRHMDNQTGAQEDIDNGLYWKGTVAANIAKQDMKTEAHIKSIVDFAIVQLNFALDSYSQAIDLLSLNEQAGQLTPPSPLEEQTDGPS